MTQLIVHTIYEDFLTELKFYLAYRTLSGTLSDFKTNKQYAICGNSANLHGQSVTCEIHPIQFKCDTIRLQFDLWPDFNPVYIAKLYVIETLLF